MQVTGAICGLSAVLVTDVTVALAVQATTEVCAPTVMPHPAVYDPAVGVVRIVVGNAMKQFPRLVVETAQVAIGIMAAVSVS